jgi:protein-disulfide isomerase
MTKREAWDIVSTTIVATAAVAMLAFYLHDRRQGVSLSESSRPYVEGWRDWGDSGIRMGAASAPMVVAVFLDFTCPHCRHLVSLLDSLSSEYPGQVAVEVHHFPLRGRELAVPSAIAAECAHDQGRFSGMYHTLFSQMDSIGSKGWASMARDAGVSNLALFEACIQSPADSFPRIAAGRVLGESIGVRGTPSVWVNGESFQTRALGAFKAKADELGLGKG